jgi:hypothetical protein
MDSIEAWKQNCEALTASAKEYQGQQAALSSNTTKSAGDAAFVSWQKTAEEVFKRFVEQQIELCHFFAIRWENYLKLPGQLARCQTPVEVGQVQTAFLSQFASDYMQEASKLSQPVAELTSRWAVPRQF